MPRVAGLTLTDKTRVDYEKSERKDEEQEEVPGSGNIRAPWPAGTRLCNTGGTRPNVSVASYSPAERPTYLFVPKILVAD